MTRLVMKFGGTSMADLMRIKNAARLVAAEVGRGHQVCVVVSAMSGKTNELVAWTDGVGPATGKAELSDDEYDVVVASGEQVTAGLLAMTIRSLGYAAQTLMGWQVPILTSDVHGKARINDIPPANLIAGLDAGQILVIPGFQGVTQGGRITTLGRGGSDTSAVAVAAAIGAVRCDIYTDVDGVYTTDPRIETKARRLKKISFEEMLEMASLGAKVLQTRSVELAMAKRVRVRVLSSFAGPEDSENPQNNEDKGTIVCDEEEIVEKHIVSGVAFSRDESKITLLGLPNKIGISAAIFSKLAAANINVDMIVQSEKRSGDYANQIFTVGRRDGAAARDLMQASKDEIGFDDIRLDDTVSKISIVGVGMRSHTGVAETMFRALSEKGINIQVISTSEIKISVLIDEAYTELAVRALHAAYGLDKIDG
jgi:aspartate kinase